MPVAPDMVHYTIVGAQDWPMFKEMLGGMRILLGGAWITTIGLLVYIYRSIIARISSERTDDKDNCKRCQAIRDIEFRYIWEAIDAVAPRIGPQIRAKIAVAKELARGGTGEPN